MKDFKIGDRVLVNAIARPDHERIGLARFKKTWKPALLKKPKEGWFVGYCNKQEGKLVHNDYAYELAFENSVKLCRIKFSYFSQDHFAFPEDCILQEGE